MIKNLLFPVIFLLAFAANGFAQATIPAHAITGIYWSPKKDAKIEIYQKAGRYFGRTIWVANPGKDTRNPQASLQQRDLLGLDLFTNFSFNDGVYEDGEIYDPSTGKTYDCKMTLNGDQLKVRGYIGISLFGRTEYFQRSR